ncbi:MAG: hypothetical protein LBU65_13900 [Planctomycetaceae bacterium]|jgi:hypothetical protein|nr:hypothetical protein [Planctomycetaceae bacterium]
MRKPIYTLLIIVSASLILGRIAAVDRVDNQMLTNVRRAEIPKRLADKRERLETQGANPAAIDAEMERTRAALEREASLGSPMFCANDRSRWCAIRALVEPDKRVVREVQNADGSTRRVYVWYAIDNVQTEKGWDTIDMVKHKLPGDIKGDGYLYSSKPPLLVTLMAIPYYAIYHGSGGRLSLGNEQYLVVRVMIVLINLLPLIVSWVLLSRLVERFGTTDWGRIFTVAAFCFGTFASTFSVTINNHVPAYVCTVFAIYSAIRLLDGTRHRYRHAVSVGLFGSLLVACELPAALFAAAVVAYLLIRQTRVTAALTVPVCVAVAAAFLGTNYAAHHTVVPPYTFKGGETNWYSYTYEREGKVRQSYWDNPVGMDIGEESIRRYSFHSTVGHHGIFSLTPIWLLSFIGGACWSLGRRVGNVEQQRLLRDLVTLTIVLSVVIFVFYMRQGQGERNYGGVVSGLRWTFWLMPLWILMMIPASDMLSKYRVGRTSAYLCVAASCFSAAYPVWNPWTMPWLYNLLFYYGFSVI